MSTIQTTINDFIIEKELGKGTFGSVYLVRRKEDNQIYALKTVTFDKLNKREQENSLNDKDLINNAYPRIRVGINLLFRLINLIISVNQSVISINQS